MHSGITCELTLHVLIEDKALLCTHYRSYRQIDKFRKFSVFLGFQI